MYNFVITSTVLVMTKLYIVGDHALSAYQAIKTIVKLIEKPAEWIAELFMLKGLAIIPEAVLFYARESVLDKVGQKRIGCHSLLAKDHGREWLYTHQKACATAVHWYIVKVMLRWAASDDEAYAPAPKEWIDWLELLEYFLRHPRSPRSRTVERQLPVTIVHYVRHHPRGQEADTLANLAQYYIKSTMNPLRFASGYEYWERIADANFNTYGLARKERKQIINQTLKTTGWGYPVTPPNYAFKPGLRILIPDQNLKIRLAYPKFASERWFVKVIDKGWEVFPGREDPTRKQSTEPLKHHEPVELTKEELDKMIRRGNALREEAMNAYVASN